MSSTCNGAAAITGRAIGARGSGTGARVIVPTMAATVPMSEAIASIAPTMEAMATAADMVALITGVATAGAAGRIPRQGVISGTLSHLTT